MSYSGVHGVPPVLTDRYKLEALIRKAGFTRSRLARQMEVSYRTVYRWLDRGVRPHPCSSHRIDELFRQQMYLVPTVELLRRQIRDPIGSLRK